MAIEDQLKQKGLEFESDLNHLKRGLTQVTFLKG